MCCWPGHCTEYHDASSKKHISFSGPLAARNYCAVKSLFSKDVQYSISGNNIVDRNNGDEGRERNTELDSRSTRSDRAIPAPTQWSDLKVNDFKAFIRHQNTIPSNRALLRLTKPRDSSLQNKEFLTSQLVNNFDFASYWPMTIQETNDLPTVPLPLDTLGEFDRQQLVVPDDNISRHQNQEAAANLVPLLPVVEVIATVDSATYHDSLVIDTNLETSEEGQSTQLNVRLRLPAHKRSLISSPIPYQRSDCLSPPAQRSCKRT